MSPHRSPLPPSITIDRSRRRAGFALVSLLVIAASVCDHQRQPVVAGDDQSRYHDRTFRVVRVVDGDTLDIDAPDGGKPATAGGKPVTRIRLWGVDTPEVRGNGRSAMHFGKEASAFAHRTLDGQDVHVVLSPRRTRGKYGRLLAYVSLDRGGRMFNEMLIEEGYAYADLRFEHHYFDRFRGIEKRARKAGVGLWKNVTLDNMPKWKQRFERKRNRKD